MTRILTNQIALVTGGGTGIGAATARLLAEAGARVVIVGRTETTLRAAAQQHANIEVLVADIADPKDAARALAEIKRRHGRLDILINNAGVAEVMPLSDVDPAHVRRVFDTNFHGLVEITRLALPLLQLSKGAIVNLASTIADEPAAGMSVYCASKAAVLALTRAWAQELAPLGVRVNAVSPGAIETPLWDPAKLRISAEQLQMMAPSVLAGVPQRRFGAAAEVAQVIAFLASPNASYVTGAQYTVGGGMEA